MRGDSGGRSEFFKFMGPENFNFFNSDPALFSTALPAILYTPLQTPLHSSQSSSLYCPSLLSKCSPLIITPPTPPCAAVLCIYLPFTPLPFPSFPCPPLHSHALLFTLLPSYSFPALLFTPMPTSLHYPPLHDLAPPGSLEILGVMLTLSNHEVLALLKRLHLMIRDLNLFFYQLDGVGPVDNRPSTD